MKKTIVFLSAALIFILAITGCHGKSGKPDIQDVTADIESTGTEGAGGEILDGEIKQVAEDLNYLTSEECAGRQAGTPGNEKAAEYIEKRFEEIGLSPFDEDYRISYNERIAKIDADKTKLEILDKDKTVETFAFGEDFIEVFLNDTNLTLPLLEEPGDVDCAILAENYEIQGEYEKNPRVKLILRLNENYRRAGKFYIEDGNPVLGVFPDAYERLKEHVGRTVRFCTEVETEDMKPDNIVGMLKGKDSSHALIVSAHFDHEGSAGETIWRGAYDNASGVCTLLNAAKILKDYYKDTLPPCDVLFCAFNSEENNLTGSLDFSRKIAEKYESVFDINIDCVGARDAAVLNVYGNESEISGLLQADLTESLSCAGIGNVTGNDEIYTSDHMKFNNAVCLSTITDLASSGIHTLADVPEQIDTEYLVQLGNGISSFIMNDLDISKVFAASQNEASAGDNGDTQDIFELLTVAEFEELYSCRLDFADDRLIGIMSGTDLSQAQTGDVKCPALEDESPITLFLDNDGDSIDDCTINYSAFTKNDSLDMMEMVASLNGFGYDKDYASSPIIINDSKYYLSDELEYSFNPDKQYRYAITFYENDDRIILVASILQGSENDKEEDYIDLIPERFPEEYTRGMAELLLSAG